MPLVIAVQNEKGGCAKTTSAYNLAADLKSRGNTVILIDNDPMKGSTNYRKNAKNPDRAPTVVSIENPLTPADLEAFEHADYIIIDGAPGFGSDPRLRDCHNYLNQLAGTPEVPNAIRKQVSEKLQQIFGFTGTVTEKLSAIMQFSDLVIVPSLASVQDLQPAINLIRNIIEPHKESLSKLNYKVLLTDSDNKTKLYSETVSTLNGMNIPTFKTYIKHREIYRQAAANGLNVIDNKTDSKAIEETKALTDEVLAHFGEI